MFMKFSQFVVVLMVLGLVSNRVWSQTKETMGVGAVKISPALERANSGAGTLNAMQRLREAMDSQLMDRFHNTRKFTLIGRTQMDELMKEISFAGSGIVNKNDPSAARAMEGAGIKYLLITTIDNFNDVRKELILEGGRRAGVRRVMQVSAVAALYDTTTFKVLETANIAIENKDVNMEQDMVRTTGSENDKLITDSAYLLADKIATRVVEVLYPAKVVGRTDDQITVNRGDGTGIAAGQTYEVYALGKEMIDPDTKESLGKEEVKVGLVRITSVQPRTSKAQLLEDKGVDVGHVLRSVLTPGTAAKE